VSSQEAAYDNDHPFPPLAGKKYISIIHFNLPELIILRAASPQGKG